MSFSKIITGLTVASFLSGCVVIAGTPSRADYHQHQELTLPASQVASLNIEAGAGSLDIVGVQGLTEIKVVADIYTDKKHPESYDLSLEKSGNTAFLVAKNFNTSGMWQGNSPRIDVVIQVPENLSLDIHDGSGSLTVSDINAAVSINDGSGGIEVKHVNGALTIVDGSGGITIDDVVGNVSIEDGSGSIYAANIKGNTDIDDGSGSLTVKNVSGMVTLDDGSGGIDVDTVGGLKIIESGSGSLKVNNVAGDFSIDS